VPLSVDTVKPEVMRAVLAAGADMINDINALRAPGAIEVVAASKAAVCLMHMQGEPRHDAAGIRTTRMSLAKCRLSWRARRRRRGGRHRAEPHCGRSGFRLRQEPGAQYRTAAPPGRTGRYPGLPLLVGMSRKSMLGLITGRAAPERVSAGIAAHMLAVLRGARILRVHDVAATRDAIEVLQAVEDY
jgi:dihydropteroate synthase